MALAPVNPTQLTPPRVAFIDERSGAISREWYRFFLSLLTATQTNQQETELTPDVASLLASYDAVFGEAIQGLESAPDGNSETATVDAKVNDLAQALLVQPRQELGTMAPLQQDNVPWLQFDTTPQGYPTGPAANGTVYWDDADSIKTLNIVMEDSGKVIQHVGEETYYRVKASAAITEGQVVMFTGTVGASGGLRGAPATGLTAFENERIMGVATQNIANNGWGYVTWFGEVKGVNTTGGAEAWVDGQILYYNPAVAGGLTKNVPVAPNPKVIVASVVHAASNGILFVRPTFGSALGVTDSNVEISGLADKDLLQYDGTQSRWENIPPSSVNVGSASNLAGGSANQIPYQTSANTTGFIAAPTAANEFLKWDGSDFQWLANSYVTPQDFGAVGDGVADDTAAVLAAFAAAGTVIDPGGSIYRIVGTTIPVTHPTQFFGTGTKFVFEGMGGFSGLDGFSVTIPVGAPVLSQTLFSDCEILVNGAHGRYGFRTPTSLLDGPSANKFTTVRPRFALENVVLGGAVRSNEPSSGQYGEYGWQSCVVVGESADSRVVDCSFKQPFVPNTPVVDWAGIDQTRGVWIAADTPANGGGVVYAPIVARCMAQGCGKFIEVTGHSSTAKFSQNEIAGCGWGVYCDSVYNVGGLNALSEAFITESNFNTIFGGIYIRATDFLHIAGVRTTLARIPDIDYTGDWYGLRILSGFRNLDIFGMRAANFSFDDVAIVARAIDVNGRLDTLSPGALVIDGLYISTSPTLTSADWNDLISLRNMSVANMTGISLRAAAGQLSTFMYLESDHGSGAAPVIDINQKLPANVTTPFAFGTGGSMEIINISLPDDGVKITPAIFAAGTETVAALGPQKFRRGVSAGAGAYTYTFVFDNTFAKQGKEFEFFLVLPATNATVRFSDQVGVRLTLAPTGAARSITAKFIWILVSGVPEIRVQQVVANL